eukprot:35201_1
MSLTQELWSESNVVTFQDILRIGEDYANYDVVSDYHQVATSTADVQRHSAFADNISLSDFWTLVYQSTHTKYRTKDSLSLEGESKYRRYLKARKWLLAKCKLPTFHYTMRIQRKSKNCSRRNIVGCDCLYFDQKDYVQGRIDEYKPSNNTHLLVLSTGSKWISYQTEITQGKLKIIDKVDRNTAIMPQVPFLITSLVPKIYNPDDEQGPIWSQWRTSLIAQNRHLWIGLKYDIILIGKKPTMISICSCLELVNGNKIICADFEGSKLTYYNALDYAQFCTYVTEHYPDDWRQCVVGSSKFKLWKQNESENNILVPMVDRTYTMDTCELDLNVTREIELVNWNDVCQRQQRQYEGRFFVISFFGRRPKSRKKELFPTKQTNWDCLVQKIRKHYGKIKEYQNDEHCILVPVSVWSDGVKCFEFKTSSSEG